MRGPPSNTKKSKEEALIPTFIRINIHIKYLAEYNKLKEMMFTNFFCGYSKKKAENSDLNIQKSPKREISQVSHLQKPHFVQVSYENCEKSAKHAKELFQV